MKLCHFLAACLCLVIFLLGPALAFAKCTTHDAWTGPDKTKHLVMGVAAGSAGTLVFKDPMKGFWAGVAVGAAKEAYDSTTPNHLCSFQDFAVTAVGSAAGAYGTAWLILPQKQGFQVAFAKRF